MASRPKRKFVKSCEREILPKHFYDNIEENEEQFLGHAFARVEYSDSQFVQSSGKNEERNGVVDDTGNCNCENIIIWEQEELPRKQEFKVLNEVLDESNYVDLPAQPDLSFSYTDAMKTITINRKTNGENGNFGPRDSENILKKLPDPKGTVKYAQTPTESFRLFFTGIT